MFKKVIFNTSAQIFGKVITASTTLLITLLIGRTLGPSGYGEFTKIFVFIGYFYTFCDFGFNNIYIKLAQKNAIYLLRIIVGIRLIFAAVLFLTAVIISFFLPYDPQLAIGFSPLVKTGIIIGSLTIFSQALFTTANAYFQKILRYDLSTIAAIIGYSAILAVTVIVTFTEAGILGYVFSYVAGGVVLVACAYFLIFKNSGKIIYPLFTKLVSQKLIRLSYPVGIALVFNLIYFRIDVFILANFRSSYEVGLYGLAYQFFEAALAVPIFFANAIYPLLTKLYRNNKSEFNKQVRIWFLILSLSSILLAILLIIVSYFIPIIIDPRFGGSISALQILSLGMPFFFISALLWHLLIIYNRQKYLLFVYGVGALVNLGANWIFIPVFGYPAAAVTTVLSEGLIMILLFLSLRNLKQ